MKTLVTGASGFLGRYVISAAQQRGHTVFSLGRSENSDYKVDLSKRNADIDQDIQMVIHAAGKAHSIPKTSSEIEEFYNVNLTATKRLIDSIEASKCNLKSFVFISTVAVYGQDYGSDISESHATDGKTPYALSKIQAEEYLMDWSKKSKVPVLILRLPLIIGDNPKGNLAKMIKGIQSGRYVSIGGGLARKSMVLAEDVATCIFDNAGKSGVFNLTDGVHPSFGQLEQLISQQLDRKIRFKIPLMVAKLMGKVGNIIPGSPVNSELIKKMSQDLIFDDQKARKILNWSPRSVIETFKVK